MLLYQYQPLLKKGSSHIDSKVFGIKPYCSKQLLRLHVGLFGVETP